MLSYINIVGMPHSGSTLLAFLLNTHPGVVSIGEVARVGELLPSRWIKKSDLCSCGKTFYECIFWNRVLAGYAARGYGLENTDFYATKDVALKPTDQKLIAFVEAVLDVSEKNFFVDASKFPYRVEPLSNVSGIDLRIIDLYRDGRGVINSWKKRLKRATLRKVIRNWIKREQQRAAAVKIVSSDRIYKLKYEELCLAPQETLRSLFNFIGVKADVPFTIKFKSRVDHHIIGNPMRTRENERIVLDEKWRKMLSRRELDLFERLGGEKINQNNGYFE
ncbi:MAG: sulfotransferase [Anaerolineales bacterium]|jgi:hypothetical protein